MTRRTWRHWSGALALGATLLTGCGSGSQSHGGLGGGGGATGGLPDTSGNGAGTGANAEQAGPGTARFHVDVASGQVTVTPLHPSASRSRAQFDSGAVRFTHATSYERPGNRGVRVLDTTMTNESGLTFASAQVLFPSISTGAPLWTVGAQVEVVTPAGSGATGYLDGAAATAKFNGPNGVCYGAAGELYVSDAYDFRIRRVAGGQVTTLAGNGTAVAVDGSSTSAGFASPRGLAWNSADNSLLVCDYAANSLRRVAADGSVTTIAGSGALGAANGAGNVATFANPVGICVASGGSTFYVTEWTGNRIRRIDFTGTNRAAASSYTVSTLAGSGADGGQDGLGAAASFSAPSGITFWNGNVFVVDTHGRRVRQVTPTGAVSTIAGTGAQSYLNGSGEVAIFNQPMGLAAVPQGLVVADTGNQRLRLLTLKNGATGTGPTSWWVRTLAGTGIVGNTDGDGLSASFNYPAFVAADGHGHVAVTDYAGQRVRQATVPGTILEPGSPNGATGFVTLTNADGYHPSAGGDVPYKMYRFTNLGPQTVSMQWWFATPPGVSAFDVVVTFVGATAGQIPLQVASVSQGSPQNAVRTLAGPANGTAGYADGEANEALFSTPNLLSTDPLGAVYVADTANHCIRRIGIDGQVTTIVGTPGTAGDTVGTGQAAKLLQPAAVAVSPDGTYLAITDFGNHKVKLAKRSNTGSPADGSTWTVTTICGGGADAVSKGEIAGTAAQLVWPKGLAYTTGGELILADTGAHWVRRLRPVNGDPTTWVTRVLAGSGANSSTDGTLTTGTIANPAAVALGQHGQIYVSDLHNVRVILPTVGTLSTLGGVGAATVGGLAVDKDNQVFATADGANAVVRLDAGGAVVVAGKTSLGGTADGTGDQARFGAGLRGLTFDSSGTLYVVDGNRIRVIEALVHGN